jgi:hypothetical protein
MNLEDEHMTDSPHLETRTDAPPLRCGAAAASLN